MSRVLFFGFNLLCGLLLGWFVFQTVKTSETYAREKREAVRILHFEDRLVHARDWFFTETEWAKKNAASSSHLKSAEAAFIQIQRFSIGFIATGAIYLLTVAVLKIRSPHRAGYLGIACGCLAFAALLNGILSPAMEISAFHTELTIPLKFNVKQLIKDIPIPDKYTTLETKKVFPGKIYYFYQIKSVRDLIFILIKEKNWFVAISILVFSVLIPALKLSLTLSAFLAPEGGRVLAAARSSDALGKWSMADVFVMSLFLGFLSFQHLNGGFETEVHTLPGMYYFAAYCALSMTASQLILSARSSRQPTPPASQFPHQPPVSPSPSVSEGESAAR